MTVFEYRKLVTLELDQTYPKEEIQGFINLLFKHTLQLSRSDVALNPNREIPNRELQFLLNALAGLKQYQPIQYVLGSCNFYGLNLEVNSFTLIPRPETEELISWTLKETGADDPEHILDIGTGSGCIAIALAKHLPRAQIHAIDHSAQALEVAKKNAVMNRVDINFIQGDILNTPPSFFPNAMDIIISNPPYVMDSEKKSMRRNVVNYEPHQALFVSGDDPMQFYRCIASLGNSLLNQNGSIFVEINQSLGEVTRSLFEKEGYTAELKKDIFGADRMVRAIK